MVYFTIQGVEYPAEPIKRKIASEIGKKLWTSIAFKEWEKEDGFQDIMVDCCHYNSVSFVIIKKEYTKQFYTEKSDFLQIKANFPDSIIGLDVSFEELDSLSSDIPLEEMRKIKGRFTAETNCFRQNKEKDCLYFELDRFDIERKDEAEKFIDRLFLPFARMTAIKDNLEFIETYTSPGNLKYQLKMLQEKSNLTVDKT